MEILGLILAIPIISIIKDIAVDLYPIMQELAYKE